MRREIFCHLNNSSSSVEMFDNGDIFAIQIEMVNLSVNETPYKSPHADHDVNQLSAARRKRSKTTEIWWARAAIARPAITCVSLKGDGLDIGLSRSWELLEIG